MSNGGKPVDEVTEAERGAYAGKPVLLDRDFEAQKEGQCRRIATNEEATAERPSRATGTDSLSAKPTSDPSNEAASAIPTDIELDHQDHCLGCSGRDNASMGFRTPSPSDSAGLEMFWEFVRYSGIVIPFLDQEHTAFKDGIRSSFGIEVDSHGAHLGPPGMYTFSTTTGIYVLSTSEELLRLVSHSPCRAAKILSDDVQLQAEGPWRVFGCDYDENGEDQLDEWLNDESEVKENVIMCGTIDLDRRSRW
jgi:hypothetical protein